MTPPVVIGIDPGVSGAVAALDAATGALLWVEDMPAFDKVVNAAGLADLLAGEVVTVAAIERVHAMPRQGVSSSFNFGMSFGVAVGVVAALRHPVQFVTPAVWKKAMGVTADKSSSRRRASELWPSASARFARVRDDGRAEACLIARWAWERAAER